MGYKVITYIRVEPDEPEIYDTYEEAEKVKEQLELMQPENIYIIEEEEDENDS